MANMKHLRIATPDLVTNSYFPALAAEELGFYKAEGVDAHVELLGSVPKAFAALRDGDVDAVAGPAHATLFAFPQYRGAKQVVALSQGTPWLLVLRADIPAKRGDLQAVKGLRIGAAPGPDAALRRLLALAGIDSGKDNVRIGPIARANASGASFGVSAARALESREIDGFWANALGSEVAVQRGIGKIVIDVRRGDGPRVAKDFTFASLATTEAMIARDPNLVAAAVRAIVNAQRALRADPTRATEVGRRRFPADAADVIFSLVKSDLPFYDPVIYEEAVFSMNRFAQSLGLLTNPPTYDQVVDVRFRDLWRI
jgi:ABC-type nitrate/sulfonate/bicarbonate transport system substrate-binding protein